MQCYAAIFDGQRDRQGRRNALQPGGGSFFGGPRACLSGTSGRASAPPLRPVLVPLWVARGGGGDAPQPQPPFVPATPLETSEDVCKLFLKSPFPRRHVHGVSFLGDAFHRAGKNVYEPSVAYKMGKDKGLTPTSNECLAWNTS